MEPIDKAWLACALETEGCISIYKKRYLRLFICNTSLEFIQRVMNICGSLGSMHARPRGSSIGKKQLYVYTMSGKSAQKLLTELKPYIIMLDKRQKIDEALSMQLNDPYINLRWAEIPRNPRSGRFQK